MLFGVGAIIYLAVGLSCLFRGLNAMKINADFEHDFIDKAYDSCSVPVFTTRSGSDLTNNWGDLLATNNCTGGQCPSTGTNWTTVWMFNGITMLLQGINLVVLTVGTFYFMPRYIGTVCNCIMGCFFNFAWIVLAMGARGSTAGEQCEENNSPVVYLGNDTWDMNGRTYGQDAVYMRFLIWL